ncbi:MAG: hypothetical protein FRX49_01069 [Trebouxia sp. A1-2]|nr:MAG: hypothetical protein FRX49_01069 [Trebouxia sp. A1-2]
MEEEALPGFLGLRPGLSGVGEGTGCRLLLGTVGQAAQLHSDAHPLYSLHDNTNIDTLRWHLERWTLQQGHLDLLLHPPQLFKDLPIKRDRNDSGCNTIEIQSTDKQEDRKTRVHMQARQTAFDAGEQFDG